MLVRAIPPEKKSGPKRTRNVMIALLASAILGIFLAFGAEFWAKNKQEFRKILASEGDISGQPPRNEV